MWGREGFIHLHRDGKAAPVSRQCQDLKTTATTTATTRMCMLTFKSPDISSCSCFIPHFYQSISERREENVPPLVRARLFSIADQTEASQMQHLKKKKKRKNSVADGKDEGFSLQQLMFLCRHKHAADLQQRQPCSPDGCFPPFCIDSSSRTTASGRERKEPSSQQV